MSIRWVQLRITFSFRKRNGPIKPEIFYFTFDCYHLNAAGTRTLSVPPGPGPCRPLTHVSVLLLIWAPKLRDPRPPMSLLQLNMLRRLVHAVKHISSFTLLLLHAPRFVMFASLVLVLRFKWNSLYLPILTTTIPHFQMLVWILVSYTHLVSCNRDLTFLNRVVIMNNNFDERK
jgi:hypothetical protein